MKSTSPGPDLLTPGQAARLCAISQSALLRWIQAGMLRACSAPDGSVSVHPDELLAFLRRHAMRIPPELSDERGAPCTRATEQFRILVVDDEEFVRDTVVDMLATSGLDCVTETAENGVMGCMRIPVFRPHLILLDVVMPDLDGADLRHVLKSSPEFADIKVVVITGYPDDPRCKGDLATDADAWLTKPLSMCELTDTVRTLLEAPREPAIV